MENIVHHSSYFHQAIPTLSYVSKYFRCLSPGLGIVGDGWVSRHAQRRDISLWNPISPQAEQTSALACVLTHCRRHFFTGVLFLQFGLATCYLFHQEPEEISGHCSVSVARTFDNCSQKQLLFICSRIVVSQI